jgi:hypothetical protein
MHPMRGQVKSIALTSAGVLMTLFAGGPRSHAFRTSDPLRAFVGHEYPLGDDYFTRGESDTYVLRCFLTREKDGLDGLALSEISIWGNRTGPWEIFEKEGDTAYVYLDTRQLSDATCLEACSTAEYRASGRCRWRKGWPES